MRANGFETMLLRRSARGEGVTGLTMLQAMEKSATVVATAATIGIAVSGEGLRRGDWPRRPRELNYLNSVPVVVQPTDEGLRVMRPSR